MNEQHENRWEVGVTGGETQGVIPLIVSWYERRELQKPVRSWVRLCERTCLVGNCACDCSVVESIYNDFRSVAMASSWRYWVKIGKRRDWRVSFVHKPGACQSEKTRRKGRWLGREQLARSSEQRCA